MDTFRKWLAFGTGVAIQVDEQDLQVTIVRVRPTQTKVLGAATVTAYKTRPAAEWGTELTAFLRKLGAAHIAASVLLPRRDIIVRTLQVPGVADRDLEAAVRLQIDSLHPFAEDDVYFSLGRIAKTSSVLIGIARREVVDQLSTTFAEAGVKVAQFTFSAAALYSAIRLSRTPHPDGFVLSHDFGQFTEVYGESPSRPIFSATFPPVSGRALELAKSELRLEPETEAFTFAGLLPRPSVFPPSHDPDAPQFASHALPYATALAGACPWLGLEANLLPAAQRRASSRVRLIPTFALGTILLFLAGGLVAQSRWADSRYLGVLQHEINRFEPQALKVAAADKAITETRARTQLLDDYRRRAKHDMDALAEITKLIPPPGWVGSLILDRQTLQIAGETNEAAGLLKGIDNSPLFESSEFTMPLTRNPRGEAFRIRAARSVTGAAPPPASSARQTAGQTYPGSLPQGLPQAETPYIPMPSPVAPAPTGPPPQPQVLLPPGFQTAQPTSGTAK